MNWICFPVCLLQSGQYFQVKLKKSFLHYVRIWHAWTGLNPIKFLDTYLGALPNPVCGA
jgi:hypothetical protein